VDAARKVYEGMLNRMRIDAAFKLDSDALYLWSRRWMEAQREVASSKAERTAAAEAHLERMRKWEKLVVGAKGAGGFYSPTDVAAAEYYRLDAEALLGQEQGRKLQ
jgi:hypothetical protein